MTSLLLARAGIPSPAVWVCESEDKARSVVSEQVQRDARVVLKPLFGNCGRGLLLLEDAGQLPAPEEVEGIYYLQEYVDQGNRQGRDWRVFVIGDQAVAAMERVSEHWITNRARGGQCLPAVLTDELRRLAERCAQVTGTGYAGVDIIRDREGNYLVLEVNSVPAWRGLQSVWQADIAELLAEDLLRRLLPKHRPSAVV
jgi:RimK family alpha-L-glutamate ligase